MIQMTELTLADCLNRDSYAIPRDARKLLTARAAKTVEANLLSLRMLLRSARRFTLSNEFVHEVVRKANCHGDEIYALASFAQLPFETVWIEYDIRQRIQDQFELGTAKAPPGADQWRAGWLMHRAVKENPHIWSALPVQGVNPAGMDGEHLTTLIHMIYNFMLPPSGEKFQEEEWSKFSSKPERAPAIVLWGYVNDKFNYGTSIELASLARVSYEPYIAKEIFKSELVNERLKAKLDDLYRRNSAEFAGDFRFLITTLAMINLVPTEYKHTEATGTHRARLKTLPLLDSQVVQILAGKTRVIQVVDHAMRLAASRHLRRHEVRGHWRVLNSGGAAERKVWVRDHERGDEKLGRVTQTFKVGVAHNQPAAEQPSG